MVLTHLLDKMPEKRRPERYNLLHDDMAKVLLEESASRLSKLEKQEQDEVELLAKTYTRAYEEITRGKMTEQIEVKNGSEPSAATVTPTSG